MEENQNSLPGEDRVPTADDSASSAAVTVPAECEVAPKEGAISSESCEAPQEATATAPTEPLPAFAFGGEGADKKKKKKAGGIAFFAIFGGVLTVCLALLILLLFVGDTGLRIIRTLHTERVIYVQEDNGTEKLPSPQAAADTVRRSTVTVSVKTESGSGTGSGFVYDANGHICTNYHVIEDATVVQVILPDGTACDAEVVGFDIPADLAVLKVQASGLVPAEIGSSASLLVGDEVVAVGTPASISFAGTATFGRVSYTSRLLPLDDNGDGVYEKKAIVIQTDTSVNPGNSGGPMADMYGRVVGIVVRKIINYNGNTYEGVGFAIPIDGARVILDAIIEKGSFTGKNPLVEGRSLLGVTGHPGKQGMWYYVDPVTNHVESSETQKEGYHYMPVDGVYAVAAQGANAQGKILPGDVILAVNGLIVRDTKELITAVNCYPCYEIVSVRIWRNGAEQTVQIMLEEE